MIRLILATTVILAASSAGAETLYDIDFGDPHVVGDPVVSTQSGLPRTAPSAVEGNPIVAARAGELARVGWLTSTGGEALRLGLNPFELREAYEVSFQANVYSTNRVGDPRFEIVNDDGTSFGLAFEEGILMVNDVNGRYDVARFEMETANRFDLWIDVIEHRWRVFVNGETVHDGRFTGVPKRAEFRLGDTGTDFPAMCQVAVDDILVRGHDIATPTEALSWAEMKTLF